MSGMQEFTGAAPSGMVGEVFHRREGGSREVSAYTGHLYLQSLFPSDRPRNCTEVFELLAEYRRTMVCNVHYSEGGDKWLLENCTHSPFHHVMTISEIRDDHYTGATVHWTLRPRRFLNSTLRRNTVWRQAVLHGSFTDIR